MRLKENRPFTLLEVLIATALTTLILSALLAAYFQAATAASDGERLRLALMPERRVEQRLLPLFYNAEIPDQKKKLFLSTPQTLIFSYQNGACLDPNFSGEVLSVLSLDPKGNLSLVTFPAFKKWKEGEMPPFRYEALLDRVESIKFDFFNLKEWKEVWSAEEKTLPALVNLSLTLKDEKKLAFTFPIPQEIAEIEK